MSDYQCSECGGREVLSVSTVNGKPNYLRCTGCTAHGTPAYFTPQVLERDEADAKVISRTFDVPGDRSDEGHIKAVNAAMSMLVRASLEEGLELDWGTLRLITSADGSVITYLAVIKAYPRTPLPEHDLGGVAVSTPDGAKVIASILNTSPRTTWHDLVPRNSHTHGMEMAGYASPRCDSLPAPTIVRPDSTDVELARRSRLE